jgi:nitrogen-specific signal transduction histidine kinase
MVGLRTSQRVSGGRRYLRLECADTGGGVSLESLPVLMKDGASSKREGSGLGLGIIRDLVRCAGGGIEVMSQPEGGAVFAVMLPVFEDSHHTPASPDTGT